MFGLIAWLVSACGSSGRREPSPSPPEPSPSLPAQRLPAGVYSLTAFDRTPHRDVYRNPSVAGVALRVRWPTLEPQERQYDWSYLDQQIQAAKSASKRVSIYVHDVPDWVYDQGAQGFELGSGGRIPIPWDPVFLEKWTQFIQAFGARYSGESAIAYTRGSTESVTDGWALPETDAFGRSWASHGYTPQRLLQAMETVVDAFLTAFPRTAHWAEVAAIKFESAVSGQPDAFVAREIAAYGFSRYPDRFGVWRENLSGCIPNPPNGGEWLILWEHKSRDGAQMLWNVQDGPNRMNQCGIKPNSKQTVLMAAVRAGLDYGMPYIEVYEADILDWELAPVIVFAAQNLR